MSKTVDDTEAERHRAKMGKRKAVQDAEVAGKTDREGPADRPHRQRQGQVDRGVRPRPADARTRPAHRRRAVHQGRLALGRARCAGRTSATRSSGTRWARVSPGTPRTSSATSPRPSAPGPRPANSWPIRASPSSSSTSSTSRCATTISTCGRSSPTLRARRPDLHVVVTGRNAKPELIEAADLVTEMSLVKHHFAAGVKAQPGIEF